MRCSRTSTQPTEARGHVARVPTVRAICIKYSSQPGRIVGHLSEGAAVPFGIGALRYVVARRKLAYAPAQRLDAHPALDIGEAFADNPRHFATLLGFEAARGDGGRAEADAACDERLLLVKRDRVLVDGDADLVQISLNGLAGEPLYRDVDEDEVRIGSARD